MICVHSNMQATRLCAVFQIYFIKLQGQRHLDLTYLGDVVEQFLKSRAGYQRWEQLKV